MTDFRFSARPNKAHLIQWRPWGEAAFEEAKEKACPVLLEVVAYWCGACQRMDEVTLSDETVIRLINERFIPVRVEEAQRPDIDARYTRGGWPTLGVLTPGGDLLFAVNSLGPLPMVDLLTQVSETYAAKRAELNLRSVERLNSEPSPAPPRALNPGVVTEIAGMVQGLADPVNGGYGLESKFPHPDANEFFLYLFEATGVPEFLEHVLLTLRKMRSGSLHDREGGGGYYRYASRPDWEGPHPEKLLGDQAGMLSNFLHAYLLTGEEWLHDAAEEVIDYMDRRLLDPDTGMFFGCEDFVRRFTGPESEDAPLDAYVDECIYTDLNARAASAYLKAWWLLGRQDCGDRAAHLLDWVWDHLHRDDGGMYHFWAVEPQVYGLLLDATAVGSAMLDAYALVGEPRYLERALELAAYIARNHHNPAGGYSDILAPGPAGLRHRVAILGQNAETASFFTLLADLSGEPVYRQAAYWALWPFDGGLAQYGVLASSFGTAMARYLSPPCIAALTGPPGDPNLRSLAGAVLEGRNNVVLTYVHSPQSPIFLRLTTERGTATFHTAEDLRAR